MKLRIAIRSLRFGYWVRDQIYFSKLQLHFLFALFVCLGFFNIALLFWILVIVIIKDNNCVSYIIIRLNRS